MGNTAQFSNIDNLIKVRLSKNPGSASILPANDSPPGRGRGGSFPGGADINSPLEGGVGGCHSSPGSAGILPADDSPPGRGRGGSFSGNAGVSSASSTSDSEFSWIADMPFSVPKELLERYCSRYNAPPPNSPYQGGGTGLTCIGNSKKYHLNIDAISEKERLAIVSQLRTCRMFTGVPLSSKLPFSYQLIPQFIRLTIARFIGRKERKNIQRWAKFPYFPLDLSVDALADILAIPYKKISPTPVVLTHDIDNPASFQNISAFLREEEKVGARSTNFIVPCKWPLDHNMLAAIKQQGHEIGIHGFDHGNKTPFLSKTEITQRIENMSRLVERYAIKGYRSPSLLRTKRLLQGLSGVFTYDSSISTSGGLFPVPNNGCATARIFECEGIAEIPLSLPSDAKLFLLGCKPHEIIELWIDCAERIRQSGGIVVFLIHSDRYFFGNKKMFSLYRELLQHFRNDARFMFKTCEELLNE